MSANKVFILVAAFFFLLLFSLVLFTTDGYGGADSFQHYLISRYSWEHPQLFLDHWGKPVFTLLSSPFSQLGYKGLLWFNVLVTLLSSLVVYRLAAKLNNQNSPIAALFFLAMPMVLLVAVSALTEPLFGFVLVLSVWLYSEKKYVLAISVLSFLPLVRTEGFVVFPVFILALALEQKWKYIPLFALGGLVYSLAGYFALHDFLWLINRNPYKMESGIYGSGPWYHFLKNSWYIFGTPLFALIVIGLLFYFPRNIKWLKEENNALRVLIAGSFAAYFIAHSYVWWKGTGGSLGLERVIAGVCPLAAIISLSGYNYITGLLKKINVSPFWFLIPFLIVVARSSYFVAAGNLPQGPEQKLMTHAAEWIKSNPATTAQKFYYYNPHIAFLLDKDIFNKAEVEQLWGLIDANDPLLWLQDGQFLVWDAHFGSNEGHTDLAQVLHKQNVKILKRFYPEEQTWVLGGYRYQIFILGKQSGWKDSLVEFIPDTNSSLSGVETKSFSVSKENEFTNVFEEDFAAVSKSEVVYLDIVIKYPHEKIVNKDEVLFVLDMNCNNRSLVYDASDVSITEQDGSEKVLTKHFMLPPLTKECGKVKAYFWNRAKVGLEGIKVDVKLRYIPQNPQ